MKNNHIYIFILLILLSGCMERLDVELSSNEFLTFRASLEGNDTLKTKSFAPNYTITEEEWPLDLSSGIHSTKATLNNALNDYKVNEEVGGGGAGVFCYTYSTSTEATVWESLKNTQFDFDGDEMFAPEPPRWSKLPKDKGDKLRIYAYAPRNPDQTDYIISIENITNSQIDYIAAVSDELDVVTDSPRESINLNFEHIFTAIKINLGDGFTDITSITISDIKTSGTFTIGSGWVCNSDNSSFTISENAATALESPILMIPQELGERAKLSITVTENSGPMTYSVSLAGKEWKQGKLITYTLHKKGEESDYVYFDLAAGDIIIDAASYSGKIFTTTSGTTIKTEVTGTHSDGKKYYVYQSTAANRSTTGEVDGTFALPTYKPVTYNGQLWADYITDNNDVKAVIHAWDDKAGATKNSTQYTDGVRGSDRGGTGNRIHISGDVNNIELTIDNIYSTYQEEGNASRDKGSIGYVPDSSSGSSLVINIIGDNRLGCIHYNNSTQAQGTEEANYLKFKGSGSLTVADANYYALTSTNANAGEDPGETSYFSNFWCAAIGNNDSADDVYGIVIESGVIFAGTTAAENCSAIGGGGNGDATITINGGTVTAVATTTGTAIGGGIGFNNNGGKGYVTINGGNVYAYNHENIWGIPSSAIGGAGSKASTGSLGNVTITGGKVYAESALGTAIGGGSSKNKEGGNAIITISGGHITAKSLANSAGIGGGTTCSRSDNDATASINENGGDATIHISGNPIIRTGSIGGGYPGTKKDGTPGGGKIGSAQITIEGGDIQAQFVMADSPDNSFNMSGGLIRNSDTSDDEYTCIQENGGAVYMEKGTFTMSGGVIKKCSASKTNSAKGGAIYIKGGTFNMSNGNIEQCSSESDGGALYLEGGNVSLTGGNIKSNVALNGNGGAICIQGGNFSMTNSEISSNAAFDKQNSGTGNGGGIYITSSQNLDVNILSGTISGNSSGRYGGGLCVDMTDKDDIVTTINIGEEESGPTINSNSATHKGGGVYVDGAKATVVLNNGTVLHNQTSAYQVNPDIAVDNGLVTLKKDGITTQVTITFNNNNLYYTSGEDTLVEQYVVASVNNKLTSNPFEKLTDYYLHFVEWNTRRDGRGTSYTNEQIVNLQEDITLFARWKNQ